MHNFWGTKFKNGYFMGPVSCTICFHNYYFKQAFTVFTKTKQIRELRQLYGKNLDLVFSSIIWYLVEESASYGRKNFGIKAGKSDFEYRFCCDL